MAFYWHQSLFFGESMALAYADYGSTGSNAFVGGGYRPLLHDIYE